MLAEQLLSEMIPKSEFIELDNIILSDTIILYYNRIDQYKRDNFYSKFPLHLSALVHINKPDCVEELTIKKLNHDQYRLYFQIAKHTGSVIYISKSCIIQHAYINEILQFIFT